MNSVLRVALENRATLVFPNLGKHRRISHYSSWRSYIGAAVTVSKWGVYLPSNYAEYLGVEMGGLKQRRNHRPTN